MQHQGTFLRDNQFNVQGAGQLANWLFSRQAVIGVILVVALLAFEVFNFDTTKYALANLLGDVSFLGIRWAAILAFAFCAIDFAGLAHLFTPERGRDEPKETWYLMGAWLLGATMNALMTWWAINLTLLEHQFGNEVLSRQQLLSTAPIFVAVLVWLTRILFIGAFSVAGDHIFRRAAAQPSVAMQPAAMAQPAAALRSAAVQPQPTMAAPTRSKSPLAMRRQVEVDLPQTDDMPPFLQRPNGMPAEPTQPAPAVMNRNRRPAMPPLANNNARQMPAAFHASPRRRE